MVSKKQLQLYGSGGSYDFEPQLDAGEKQLPGLRDEEFYKYAPFDKLTIQNDSSEDVEIKLDDDDSRKWRINSGTSRVLTGRWYSLVSVKNIGNGAISSGKVTLEIERRPMNADKRAFEEAQQDNTVAEQVIEKFTGVNPDRTSGWV